jgi:hypothetical protein
MADSGVEIHMAEWVQVFLVAEGPVGEFTIIEAKGYPLPEDGRPDRQKTWKIRKGCLIDTVPSEKIYRSRTMAQARAEELRKASRDPSP